MKVLQISTDYFDTSVYKNLFSSLQDKVTLRILVKSNNDSNITNISSKSPRNLFPLLNIESRLFGIQINGFKIAKHIHSNRLFTDCTLIHSHYLLIDGFIAYLLSKKMKVKYVVSIRATCILSLVRKAAFHNYFTSCLVLYNAESIYFQSSKSLNVLLSNLPSFLRKSVFKKSLIIPNGIDDFWHVNLNQKKSLSIKSELQIVTVASIEENKNQLTVALAIEELNKMGYNFKYNIIGKVLDSDYYSKINHFKFVNYLGSLDRNELLNVYRSSDIFIMISHKETFGLVYAEALSQGLPIIYSKNQGFDNQFNDGFVGFNVSSTSVIELRDSILNVLADYDELSINAIKSVSKFNWETIGETYYKSYLNVSI